MEADDFRRMMPRDAETRRKLEAMHGQQVKVRWGLSVLEDADGIPSAAGPEEEFTAHLHVPWMTDCAGCGRSIGRVYSAPEAEVWCDECQRRRIGEAAHRSIQRAKNAVDDAVKREKGESDD